MNETCDDPDETEGRKLYRQRADKLARIQINIAKRNARVCEPSLTEVEKKADRQFGDAIQASVLAQIDAALTLARGA